MLLLLHAGLVKKCFLLGWDGAGAYSRVGAYQPFGPSGWALS